MYRILTTKEKSNIRRFIKGLTTSELQDFQRRIKLNYRNLLEAYLMDRTDSNLYHVEACQYSREVISKMNQTNNK